MCKLSESSERWTSWSTPRDELIMTADKYNGSVAYARAKRALTVLTELWAKAWAEQNIAVNSMHPGWADTPGVQTALPKGTTDVLTLVRLT